MSSRSNASASAISNTDLLSLFYMAVLNYDFDEMEVLYKKLEEKDKKKCKFLIKCAQIKHSFKT
jgi:hypothetical protein